MEEKISFIEQIRIALSKPLWYKTLFQQPLGKHIRYFFALLILITVIRFVIPVTAYLQSVGGLKSLIMDQIPAFSLENGVLSVDNRLDKEQNGIRFVIDTDVERYTVEDAKKLAEEMETEVPVVYMFSQSNLVSNVNGAELPFSSLGPLVINNQSIYNIAPIYLLIYGSLFFVYQILSYLFGALLFSLFGYLLSKALNLNLRFAQIYVITLYAKSFEILLESVLQVVGLTFLYYIGSIVGIFITCNYMTRGMTSMILKLPERK